MPRDSGTNDSSGNEEAHEPDDAEVGEAMDEKDRESLLVEL